MQNDYFLVPREEVPGSNSGRCKQLVLFKVIIIDYYKHYENIYGGNNKLSLP